MALAVPFSPPAMDGEQPGPGAGPGVHPFFTAQRGRSREPADEGGLDFDGTTDGAADLAGGARKARRTRKRSQEKGIQQSTLNFGRTSATLSEDKVPDEPSNQPIATEEAVASEGQRKRQRTESLERPATPRHENEMHPLGWEEQLIQAGFGGSSPAPLAQSTTQVAPPEEVRSTTLPIGAAAEATAQKASEVAATPEPKAQTPPKKVIKLRMDGKLASPKAKDDGIKKPQGKRKNGQPARLERRLVSLRYGSDEASRTEFGGQIEDILSRTVKIMPPAHLQKQVQPATEPTKPKTTHPFFMGKVARVRLGSNPPQSQDESDVVTSGPERPKSPQKPAAASSKSSWAGFGASFTKPQRPLGAIEAIWPPKDMVHVRGTSLPLEAPTQTRNTATVKKLKGSKTRVEAQEDVLSGFRGVVGFLKSASADRAYLPARQFHRPGRKLLTGEQLALLVKDQLTCREPQDAHPAIARLYKEAQTSLSAFDRFECENQEWAHKYAPKRVADVLCRDSCMLLLRDWIVGMTVNTVNSGSGPPGAQQAAVAKKLKARARKKRKISDGLDDFVVSSEDEAGIADEVTDPEDEPDAKIRLPRLSQRTIHRTKAVVLSGPHGCGKTASVYAAAQELGFEVFEINSGTRRSGRDIMDRVGDMTRNHLVRQLPDEHNQDLIEEGSPAPDAQAEVESGRQSTMNSFFQAKPKPKAKKKQTKLTKEPAKKKPETPKKPSRKQKQSLILLEEVDVLFEEDKQFWSTVLTLLLSSRRPVIMTCTSENTLPVTDMIDVATLRITAPPEALVVDYLLLLAANEGHLISYDAMTRLFRMSGNDLRASIVQLDFLGQMALGDTKGGLEWMLIRSNVKESQNERGEALRVISESTFTRSMTTLMPDRDDDTIHPRGNPNEELYLLQDVYNNWQLEPEEWIDADIVPETSTSIQALRRFEAAADGLSCADILPGMSFLDPECSRVDATHPPLTDKERSSYPDGCPLLDTPLSTDPTSLAPQMVLAVQLFSRHLRQPTASLSPGVLSSLLSHRGPSFASRLKGHATYLANTLQPLVLPSPTYLGHTSPSRLPATLPRILATDIAPYVRSIVAADLKLEENRLRLSSLMSEGGGKKARTTRASRAALEGGRKESTRRERWFRSEMNYRDVKKTGKEEWEDASLKVMQQREKVKEEEERTEMAASHAETEHEHEHEQEVTIEDKIPGLGEVAAIGETGAKGQVAMELD